MTRGVYLFERKVAKIRTPQVSGEHVLLSTKQSGHFLSASLSVSKENTNKGIITHAPHRSDKIKTEVRFVYKKK